MRQPHIAPPGADTFLISIDSYEDGKMTGTLDSVIMSAPVSFSSLPSLIMLIDNIPESLQSILSPIDPAFEPSFELEVLFRQHHTWQGRIKWDAGQKQATFKSVLELLFIIEMAFGD